MTVEVREVTGPKNFVVAKPLLYIKGMIGSSPSPPRTHWSWNTSPGPRLTPGGKAQPQVSTCSSRRSIPPWAPPSAALHETHAQPREAIQQTYFEQPSERNHLLEGVIHDMRHDLCLDPITTDESCRPFEPLCRQIGTPGPRASRQTGSSACSGRVVPSIDGFGRIVPATKPYDSTQRRSSFAASSGSCVATSPPRRVHSVPPRSSRPTNGSWRARLAQWQAEDLGRCHI